MKVVSENIYFGMINILAETMKYWRVMGISYN